MGEIVLRVLGFGHAVQYRYVPELGWVHQPNQLAKTVGGWGVRINSGGLRGPEYQIAKPPGTLRVLLVGDSFTFGYGVAEDSTYGRYLEELLRVPSPSCPRPEVLNAGVNGYNARQEVAFIRRLGLRYNPDIVILGFTPNDLLLESQARLVPNRQILKEVVARSAVYQFLAPRIRSLLLRGESHRYDAVMSRLGAEPDSHAVAAWDSVRNVLRELQTAARAAHFTPVVVALPIEQQVQAGPSGWLSRSFQSVQEQTGLLTVDLLPEFFRAAGRHQALFLEEPTKHPNPQGHRIAAQEIYASLIRWRLIPECMVRPAIQATSPASSP
jgi:lysophospholipase L1-like esterase